MQVIATIRKGHTIKTNGQEFLVLGSNSIRGNYYYIVSRKIDGAKLSISRNAVMSGQANNQITVTA